jgi:CTP synthase
MAKVIFVTGGVCSSLGKGITASSLGTLLEGHGISVTLQKFDPYINVDPGTMSPYQHGEVYVTDDGAETDLDLGHYERFVNCDLSAINSVTTGQIYKSVIERERRGEYLGQTVQVIPHITSEIKRRIRMVTDKNNRDVLICEIGGTVGDIEGIPFLEAIRQFGHEDKGNVLFIHLTLIPHIGVADEMKTKPTQHSVRTLREIGIFPDVLVCRCRESLTEDMKRKISLFCDVEERAIISARDIRSSIYEIPTMFHTEGLDRVVIEKLHLSAREYDPSSWQEVLNAIQRPEGEVEIAFVGKYTALKDAYKSIDEALHHGGFGNRYAVKVRKVESEDVERNGPEEYLRGAGGILVPGGFGTRGLEGKIRAIQYAREHRMPFFGICLGMQCAVVEFARNVLGWEGANTTEAEPDSPYPVISLLTEQLEVTNLGGTMRLGKEPCDLAPDSLARAVYGEERIGERHRHRYEFNPKYRQEFERAGMRVSGVHPRRGLVEIIEIPDHPWFLACQFHPEFNSRPRKPHPLFKGFVRASIEHQNRQKG